MTALLAGKVCTLMEGGPAPRAGHVHLVDSGFLTTSSSEPHLLTPVFRCSDRGMDRRGLCNLISVSMFSRKVLPVQHTMVAFFSGAKMRIS